MEDSGPKLPVFPYKPYSIQVDFMNALYRSLRKGGVSRLESPTAILLADADTRYASDSSKRSSFHPTSKLPQWFKDRLISSTNNYGEVHRLLHHFFKLNKKSLTA